MADVYTGISVLKRINSLFKGKVNSSPLPIEKSDRPAPLKQIKSSARVDKIITPEVKLQKVIQITGARDEKIHELICQRLTCEKAIRLKQEIKNFSSAWLSRLS